YSYDAADRLLSEQLNGTTQAYAHDDTGQLTADGLSTLSYDGAGNRTNPGYQTGLADRLLSDGSWNYSYDAAGNLVSRSNAQDTLTYHVDERDHFLWAEETATAGGALLVRVQYTNDVFGNRLAEAVSLNGGVPTLTRFAQDGWKVSQDAQGNR